MGSELGSELTVGKQRVELEQTCYFSRKMSTTTNETPSGSKTNGGGTSSTGGSADNRQRNPGRGNHKKKGEDEDPQLFKVAYADFNGIFITSEELHDGRECNFKKVMTSAEVYVASNYPKSARTMSCLFEEQPRQPSLTRPLEPVGGAANNHLQVTMFMEDLKRFNSDEAALSNNLHSFFTILWGQCSPGVQAKVRSKMEFLVKKEGGDCAWLIEEVRQVLFNLGTGKQRIKVLHQAKLELLRFQQGRLPTVTYYDKFVQIVYAYERSGGTLGNDKGVLAYVDKCNQDVRNLHPGEKPVPPIVTPEL